MPNKVNTLIGPSLSLVPVHLICLYSPYLYNICYQSLFEVFSPEVTNYKLRTHHWEYIPKGQIRWDQCAIGLFSPP